MLCAGEEKAASCSGSLHQTLRPRPWRSHPARLSSKKKRQRASLRHHSIYRPAGRHAMRACNRSRCHTSLARRRSPWRGLVLIPLLGLLIHSVILVRPNPILWSIGRPLTHSVFSASHSNPRQFSCKNAQEIRGVSSPTPWVFPRGSRHLECYPAPNSGLGRPFDEPAISPAF